MTKDELKTALKQHAAWVCNETNGKRLVIQNGADLTGADLYGANLKGANLEGANLKGANLKGTKIPLHQMQIVPSSGSFFGFKKTAEGAIIRLLIPASAKRVGGVVGRKCRASEVFIESVLDGRTETEFTSTHDSTFRYKLRTWVKPDKFNDSPFVECSYGIHFFITEQEAREYS